MLLFAASLPLIGARGYQESDPIRVLSSTTENDFPNGLTFNISAEADSPITSISLYYYTRGAISATRQPLEITPGSQVTASYTWDTSAITVSPSAPVFYYWELDDEAGNELITEEQFISYDDLRFPWNELSDDELIVRWYEGDQDFGEYVFQTSRQALDQMKSEAGRGLDFPITILLYANAEEFQSAFFFIDDWVGGRAYPAMGITIQTVGPNQSIMWIGDVIPHEIAHLFFFQAAYTGISSWPSWFDEGYATFYEFSANEAYLSMASEAARDGTLLPLSSLSGGFGRDPDFVRLAYAESFSSFFFLMETWGDEALQSMIASFRNGTSARDAIEDATGLTWEEFIAAWITWMGVPATPAAPPTPTEGLVFPTAPSGWPTVTPRAQTDDPESEDEGFKLVDLPVCGGLFGAIALPGLTIVFRHRRRRKGDPAS
jgi:hypothetical protein